MYDDLAAVYDRFIDWPTRLARELPRLGAWLADSQRVLDLACGTGRHAHGLAALGYEVVGCDPSPGALAHARRLGGRGSFVEAGFGELSNAALAPFDAVYCLGNSLPHLLTLRGLRRTFADLGRVVRPGGRLLLGLRNLPLAAARGERWLPLRSHVDPDGTQWLFDRLYDFRPRDLLDFWFVVHWAAPGAAWQRETHRTTLRAWHADTLVNALAGWSRIELWADLDGTPFDAASSGDLFLSAIADNPGD